MVEPFTLTRRVQFAETDMAGIMHFANYYRWMEEIEHAFFRSRGLSIRQPMGDWVASWPRVKSECTYKRPVRFEDEVELALRVIRLSDKTLTHEVTFMHDGNEVACGATTIVCCRVESGDFKSIPIPDEIRTKLQGE